MSSPANRMIVPAFWAEASLKKRTKQKQVTVRRFGWSDTSQQEAQTHAQARAEEALQRALSGEKKFLRREPKVAYNGAHGVPIREEILSRHGDTIITRNSYGAHCLNTPNVLFADIDHDASMSLRYGLTVIIALFGLAVAAGIMAHSLRVGIILVLASLFLGVFAAKALQRACVKLQGGAQAIAHRRIGKFVHMHPGWKLRLYKTPAGLRIMALHRLFDLKEPAVTEFFKAIGTDPIYARMCLNQQCFRARVSAKPWRIGIEYHMKPRPGTWPVAEDKLPMRAAWVEAYEAKAAHYAACQYVETVGNGITHPDVLAVQELHDELCGALTQRALA